MNKVQGWGASPESKGWQGLNNAAIHTFNSNVINSLVRELFQNSIDARQKMISQHGDDNKPTIIKLRKLTLSKDDFPNYNEYRNFLKLVANSGPNKKQKDFFKNAFSELDNSQEINLFGFEDYNTPGLSGTDDDPQSTFSSCVLSEGTSIDKSDTAGGSYGIGKNAIFGFSKIRTVFYSSLNPKNEYIFQGVAKLASFYDEDDNQFGYRVYYGKGDSQKSIRDVNELPTGCKQLFKRDELGLSQYAVSPVLREDNWDEEFIKAIIRNYWMLIANEKLEIEIIVERNLKHTIKKSNLEELLLKYYNPETYEPEGIEPDGNPYDFYQAYTKVKPVTKDIQGLGKVNYHCLELDHKNTNRVAYLRNNMTIYSDSVWGFGSIGYCGVFYCTDKKGNVVLRLMEPPTHDSFDPDRLDERSGKHTSKDGEKILSDIKKIVREPLKKILDKYKEPAEDIEWLDDLLESLMGDNNSGLGKRTGKASNEETTEKLGRNIDMQISFKSKTGNSFVNHSSGEETDEGGGEGEGEGGGKRTGSKKKKKKKREGGGPYGRDDSQKTKIDSRIFLTGATEEFDGIKYKRYKVILRSEKKLEPNDILLTQQGDSGEVVDYELGKVTDTDGNEFNFKEIKNKSGDSSAYVIEKINIPSQLYIYVNEPYKSSFKIVRG